MDIGERIKELREEFGFTQLQVAAELGITQQAYSYYEKNLRSPDGEIVKRLSMFYGVTSDYLLGMDDLRTRAGVNVAKSYASPPPPAMDSESVDLIVEKVLKKLYEKFSDEVTK